MHSGRISKLVCEIPPGLSVGKWCLWRVTCAPCFSFWIDTVSYISSSLLLPSVNNFVLRANTSSMDTSILTGFKYNGIPSSLTGGCLFRYSGSQPTERTAKQNVCFKGKSNTEEKKNTVSAPLLPSPLSLLKWAFLVSVNI